MTFQCGHPRTPENTYTQRNGRESCRLCRRIRNICKSVEKTQQRINAGKFTIGERIARGLA